jgi:hypothetical protein
MKHEVAEAPAIGATADMPTWDDGVQIDAFAPLDRLVVKTRNSVYDVVVVSPHEGNVLVRGGRLFPEFRQARLVGATAGCHTVKLLGVYVGLSLEFFAGRSVTTSTVLEIYRPAACASETSAASS